MSISRIGFVLLLLLLGRTPAATQDDPNEVLLKVRQKVAENISHLPNYLCTETVSRQVFEINAIHTRGGEDSCQNLVESKEIDLVTTDRLRLDVALSSDSEMYSWVGEGRFDDRNLSEIVKQGTTSTGSFGSFLRAIFLYKGAAFTFKGKSHQEGREVFAFDFSVPLKYSGYYVSNATVSRLTGYTGGFEVDAGTLDLLKLEIRTNPLPPELHICKSSTAVKYSRVSLNGGEVLLPSEVNVSLTGSDAHQSRNQTVFSGCHEFMGESKLIFHEKSADDEMPAPPAAPAKVIHLREGLKLTLALAQNIDPISAAAGDPIKAKLAKAVKDPQSQLVMPKGTIVNGRLFEVTMIHPRALSMLQQLEFGVKWDSFELDGLSQPLQVKVKSAVALSSRLPLMHGQLQEVQSLTRTELPGIGFFLFPFVEKTYKVPIGFESNWVTVSTPAVDGSTQP